MSDEAADANVTETAKAPAQTPAPTAAAPASPAQEQQTTPPAAADNATAPAAPKRFQGRYGFQSDSEASTYEQP